MCIFCRYRSLSQNNKSKRWSLIQLQVCGLRILLLLFAKVVVPMASSVCDLQHSLDWFAAKCETAGMKISTSKSEAMVLSRKPVDCPLRVGNESLPQVKEFRYLRILFTSEGTMDRETSRRIWTAGAVLRSRYHTIVMKRELSQEAKLLIYRSVFVPSLTYGNEGWVLTERTSSPIQAAEMGFPQEGGWCLPLGWGEKFSHLWEICVERAPLHWKELVEVVQASDKDTSWSPP